MDLDLYKSELCLTDNAPIRLLSARGVRITCTAGLVWLTIEGEAGDVFLAPGQSHLVRGRGLGLLEGIGSGRVRFEKTAQPVRNRLLVGVQRLWHGWRPCLPPAYPSLEDRAAGVHNSRLFTPIATKA
ncbi:MAG: DUF2917 domain-containing protein [Candidatus Accumulibacter sp.]|jgi:hypothetical protein|nr:DUF2917 domain-containing protein [Candidatus Accumulibacter necessarius]